MAAQEIKCLTVGHLSWLESDLSRLWSPISGHAYLTLLLQMSPCPSVFFAPLKQGCVAGSEGFGRIRICIFVFKRSFRLFMCVAGKSTNYCKSTSSNRELNGQIKICSLQNVLEKQISWIIFKESVINFQMIHIYIHKKSSSYEGTFLMIYSVLGLQIKHSSTISPIGFLGA